MLKNVNKRSNIQCRKNKEQCRTLPHTYICIIDSREKQVSRILGGSTYKIIRKKVNNTICKAKVSENQSKHTVIQRRKELCNIKSNNTSFESFGPASLYQMGQKHTSILHRLLGHTSKLVRMKDTILDNIKLKSSSNHFLNELVKSVKQNNRPKDLENTISRLT